MVLADAKSPVRKFLPLFSYFALTVATTWPLVGEISGTLPLGTEKVASVPALNAWTVWWNADRARYAFTDYWHAPIFSPARYAFAFSEAQPTSLLVVPIVYAAGPAAAYNVYLLTVLTLNGAAAFRLLKRVGLAFVPALLGGGLVETLPMVHWQLGVLQLTTICGVVWVIDRVVALRNAPTIANSALLGVAAFLCYAACNYFGLFLSVLLPIALLPLVFGRWFDWRFWLLSAASVVVVGALSSPILWAQFQAKHDYEWKREESLLVSLSAKPRDYLTTPWQPFVEGPDYQDPQRPLWMLGGGPFKLILAATGIIVGLCIRGRRRWTLFLILFGAAAFGLSLGPAIEIGTWSPYKMVMAIHPGLALARSPFRFAFFVQLATALLAANAVDGLWRVAIAFNRSRGIDESATIANPTGADEPRTLSAMAASSEGNGRPPERRGGKSAFVRFGFASLGATVAIAAGVYATAEVWPARQKLLAMPSLDSAWIGWLTRNTDPHAPILCLPFPRGATVGDYERTALFMLEQIGHRRPMVGGYSGFFPQEFLRLKDAMENFPNESVMVELRSRHVSHVVIADPTLFRFADRSPSLRLAFRDGDAKVRIYKLLPPPIDYERFFKL